MYVTHYVQHNMIHIHIHIYTYMHTCIHTDAHTCVYNCVLYEILLLYTFTVSYGLILCDLIYCVFNWSFAITIRLLSSLLGPDGLDLAGQASDPYHSSPTLYFPGDGAVGCVSNIMSLGSLELCVGPIQPCLRARSSPGSVRNERTGAHSATRKRNCKQIERIGHTNGSCLGSFKSIFLERSMAKMVCDVEG